MLSVTGKRKRVVALNRLDRLYEKSREIDKSRNGVVIVDGSCTRAELDELHRRYEMVIIDDVE